MGEGLGPHKGSSPSPFPVRGAAWGTQFPLETEEHL